MSLDIVYDFIFLIIWMILSSSTDANEGSGFFTFAAVCSGIIFGFDIYQVYMFFYRYNVEDVHFEGRDIIDEEEIKEYN